MSSSPFHSVFFFAFLSFSFFPFLFLFSRPDWFSYLNCRYFAYFFFFRQHDRTQNSAKACDCLYDYILKLDVYLSKFRPIIDCFHLDLLWYSQCNQIVEYQQLVQLPCEKNIENVRTQTEIFVDAIDKISSVLFVMRQPSVRRVMYLKSLHYTFLSCTFFSFLLIASQPIFRLQFRSNHMWKLQSFFSTKRIN